MDRGGEAVSAKWFILGGWEGSDMLVIYCIVAYTEYIFEM